jgi:hypothetical protein
MSLCRRGSGHPCPANEKILATGKGENFGGRQKNVRVVFQGNFQAAGFLRQENFGAKILERTEKLRAFLKLKFNSRFFSLDKEKLQGIFEWYSGIPGFFPGPENLQAFLCMVPGAGAGKQKKFSGYGNGTEICAN